MTTASTATEDLTSTSAGDGGDAGIDHTGSRSSGGASEPRRHALSSVRSVRVDALTAAGSPRLRGIDLEHARALAESDATLPPILVHRGTMRVIDGTHRLRAALLRQQAEVPVQFFEGGLDDAFVLSVERNVKHGLPLSAADRTRAAARILRTHPQWSDRTVASTTGLSARTVRGIRLRAEGPAGGGAKRIGRDGRARPLSTADARRRASAYLAANPGSSLREVAAVAGISPGTVRDVRDRARRGEDPVPPGRRTKRERAPVPYGAPAERTVPADEEPADEEPGKADAGAPSPKNHDALLHQLSRDPSLRFTENGRYLLRMMSIHLIAAERRQQLARSVPAHCAGIAADLARECAQAWAALAGYLERPPTT